MPFFRSLLFTLIFYPGTLVAVLAAFPAAAIDRAALNGVVRSWLRFHHYCVRYLLGIRTRIEGDIPPGPALVAAKHQSMFETVEMALILGLPAVVLKQELADIPLWGWAAKRYGAIPVDRKGGAKALRIMMKAAKQAIGEGRAILIFPEGTRVSPGRQPPLQSGFAGLYRALKLPVVPVALDSGTLWPRQAFVKRPGLITIRFGKVIEPGLSRKEIESKVHSAINALDD
jgi:1-acyl-sn-glycerol-3-phosphate acyltransferase